MCITVGLGLVEVDVHLATTQILGHGYSPTVCRVIFAAPILIVLVMIQLLILKWFVNVLLDVLYQDQVILASLNLNVKIIKSVLLIGAVSIILRHPAQIQELVSVNIKAM